MPVMLATLPIVEARIAWFRVSSQLIPNWRIAVRFSSASLTWSRIWRGPGTLTRLISTAPPPRPIKPPPAPPPPPIPPPMPPPPMLPPAPPPLLMPPLLMPLPAPPVVNRRPPLKRTSIIMS